MNVFHNAPVCALLRVSGTVPLACIVILRHEDGAEPPGYFSVKNFIEVSGSVAVNTADEVQQCQTSADCSSVCQY